MSWKPLDIFEKFLHPNKLVHQHSNPNQTKSKQIRNSPDLLGKTLQDEFSSPPAPRGDGKETLEKHVSVFWHGEGETV